MKLLKLHLKNFKGIKEFTLDTQGQDVNIFGDNATGKTTLADAFMWLLFDKDSLNRKDFEIKTLDQNGQPIHGLEHEVEGTLDIGGQQLTLRKVYKEKWTKKRGSATAEFTGHTTDYFIDGVPVTKREYESRIAEIANKNIFRLLTDPLYFNEQLHWQNRRKLLLEICGDISDEEVISSNKNLAKLPEILQGRRLEDYRKIIAVKKAEINKELEKIPVRISEVQLSLPNIDGIIPEALDEDIAKLKQKLQAKQQELARIESGGAIAEKIKKLRAVEAELLEMQNEHRLKLEQEIQNKLQELKKAKEKESELSADLSGLQKSIVFHKAEITRMEERITALRNTWYTVNSKKLDLNIEDVCPTCGQILPPEKVEEIKSQALAKFNREKAEKLEEITREGTQLKKQLTEYVNAATDMENKVASINAQLNDIREHIGRLQKEIELLRQQQGFDPPGLKYNNKYFEKIGLEKEIKQLKEDNTEVIQEIKDEVAAIEQDISALEEAKAKVKRYEEGRKRIDELMLQERQLAAEYEKLENELYLTEQFIQTKVKLLEDKINSKFKLARFKLFDIQVNGAVVECCETTFQGIPYSNLNHGAQINIGLDIINTLSEHYGFDAPIFIDNAEAVTQLIPTRGQQIRLIVSANDKKLRVEVMQNDSSK